MNSRRYFYCCGLIVLDQGINTARRRFYRLGFSRQVVRKLVREVSGDSCCFYRLISDQEDL